MKTKVQYPTQGFTEIQIRIQLYGFCQNLLTLPESETFFHVIETYHYFEKSNSIPHN